MKNLASEMSEHKKKQREYYYKMLSLYKATFSQGAGLEVLKDLKKRLGFQQTVVDMRLDDKENYFNLGRQSVINDLMNHLNTEMEK